MKKVFNASASYTLGLRTCLNALFLGLILSKDKVAGAETTSVVLAFETFAPRVLVRIQKPIPLLIVVHLHHC